jgi:transcriptional regulator with XRE-family HTH domain
MKFRPGKDVLVIPAPPGADASDAEVTEWIERVRGANIGLEADELEAWAQRVRGFGADDYAEPIKGPPKSAEKEPAFEKITRSAGIEHALKLAEAIKSHERGEPLNRAQQVLLKDLDVDLLRRRLIDKNAELARTIAMKEGQLAEVKDRYKEVIGAYRRNAVSDIAAAWGDLCKHIRAKKNWNQRQIGALLGVRQATVSRWELGLSAPDPASRSKLIAVARDLEIDHSLSHDEAKVEFIQLSLRITGIRNVVRMDAERGWETTRAIAFVPPTSRSEGTRAILVATDALGPRYDIGDVIIVGGIYAPADMLDIECLALLDDETLAFGVVRRVGNDFFLDRGQDLPRIRTVAPVVTVIRSIASTLA